MKYKNLEEVVKQLQGAVKAHGNQAKIVKKHIEEMKGGSPKKLKDEDGSGDITKKDLLVKLGKLNKDGSRTKEYDDNAPTNMSAYKFNEDAVNKARKKRISKRMADPDVSMNKFRRNLKRLRKDKEKGRY